MLGTTIAHYRILSQLGEGGMGVVFKAQDEVLQRLVALKVLRPETVGDESRRQRFLQEARSAAALNHPSIATIFAASDFEGSLFIAMELIEGESLRARLQRGALPYAEAIRVATEIARGLAHAHAQRVVHRDLKPENVMLGTGGQAKILDFGLAKILTEPSAGNAGMTAATLTMALTFHGQVMGTPAYMSPEQARGQTLDFRSDQFSFGAMLREMLTGAMTFAGPSPADTVSAVLTMQVAPPSKVDVHLPAGVDRIVARCLEKNPQDRYADTAELVRDLEALDPHRAAAGRVAVRRVQSLLPPPLVLSAAALLVVAGGLFWWRPWRSLSAHRSAPTAPADGTAAAARPNWIMVADVDGTGVDASLCTATRELITASLAQSDVVTPISRPQIQRALKLADKPDTTRVRGELARQLATRAAARTYVEGRVDKVLTGYSLVLRANDTESGNPIVTVNGVAENDAAVIGTLDKLGRELREKLGEKASAVRSTSQLRAIITPSFGAYRDYIRAIELQRDRKYAASNTMLRSALAQDAEFASAWKAMGTNFNNLGQLDSARTSFDNAMQHPERLTENERLGLKIFVAYVDRYDLQQALLLYDALVRASPFSSDVYTNRGTILFALGRYEEALAAQQRAAELSPYGLSELLLLNQHHTLIQLGRYADARQAETKLSGGNEQIARLELAISTGAWPQADSLAAAIVAGPQTPALGFQARLVRAALQVQRGEVAAGSAAVARLLEEVPLPFWTDLGRMASVQLQVLRGERPDLAGTSAARDTSTAGWIVRGIAAAASGDTAAATRCWKAVRGKPEAERRRYETDTKLLEGWRAVASGDNEAAISLLAPLTTAGQGPWFVGRLPIRWLLAVAEERGGHLEDASQVYELVLSSERLHHDVWTWQAALLPYANQRLAVLYMRLGKRDEAEKHAKAFHDSWVHPDPALRPLLDEAREALASGA